VEPTIPNK